MTAPARRRIANGALLALTMAAIFAAALWAIFELCTTAIGG